MLWLPADCVRINLYWHFDCQFPADTFLLPLFCWYFPAATFLQSPCGVYAVFFRFYPTFRLHLQLRNLKSRSFFSREKIFLSRPRYWQILGSGNCFFNFRAKFSSKMSNSRWKSFQNGNFFCIFFYETPLLSQMQNVYSQAWPAEECWDTCPVGTFDYAGLTSARGILESSVSASSEEFRVSVPFISDSLPQ